MISSMLALRAFFREMALTVTFSESYICALCFSYMIAFFLSFAVMKTEERWLPFKVWLWGFDESSAVELLPRLVNGSSSFKVALRWCIAVGWANLRGTILPEAL